MLASPKSPKREKEAAKEEISDIFGALLEEEIPKPAEIFIHVILRQMDGEPMGPTCRLLK